MFKIFIQYYRARKLAEPPPAKQSYQLRSARACSWLLEIALPENQLEPFQTAEMICFLKTTA